MPQFIMCNRCKRYINLADSTDCGCPPILGFLTKDGRGMNLCMECIITLDDSFTEESWDEFLRENNMLEE